HTGKVVRLASFGAFVSLGGGVDGLLHVSRLGGGKRLKSAGEAVRLGQAVEVKVDSVDAGQRRISLSLAEADGADAQGEETDDYRKYLEPPPSAPGLGSLGEALKATLARKKGK
ncbi:MAG: S1 RNA-binding domain-containing protein, partial [Verrucomicrobiota bacterium]